MHKRNTLKLSKSLDESIKALPLSRSAVISQSLMNAARDPSTLGRAFNLRLNQPPEEESITISYTRSHKLDESFKKLTEMTRLPGEQVVRLCLEAYIHRL